jgi:hypothetical protein
MLGDLEANVDQTDSKLSNAMRRMKRFVRDTEGKSGVVLAGGYNVLMFGIETKSGWCITILVVVLIVLLLAVILM